MGEQFCVFRNCNTIDTPGKGEMAPSCREKGCTGGPFASRPDCRTFMRDLLPPEPIFGTGAFRGAEFTNIIRLEKRDLPAPSIFLPCRQFPARAVGQR